MSDWIDELVDWQLADRLGGCYTNPIFSLRREVSDELFSSGAMWTPGTGWGGANPTGTRQVRDYDDIGPPPDYWGEVDAPCVSGQLGLCSAGWSTALSTVSCS